MYSWILPTTISSSKPVANAVFRRGGVALATLLAAFALPLSADEPKVTAKTLKISTTSPAGSSWMKVLSEAIAEVETVTEGRVKFKVYHSGSQGKDDTIAMRRIGLNQLQGALVTAAVFSRRYPDAQIYNLPMAFRSLAEVDAVRETLDPVLIAGLRKVGFETFGIAEVGMAYAMSKKEARTVADSQRLKVWAPSNDPAALRTLEAFDISPTPLTIGDVWLSLNTNVIDTVAAPLVAVVPLQWHTQLKYIVDLPLMYIYGFFVVSDRALQGVAKADLEAMRRILGAAVAQADRRNRADLASIRQTLENQGLQYITLTQEEREDWESYGKTASKRWSEEGIIGTDIYDTLTTRLDEIRAAEVRTAEVRTAAPSGGQ